MQLRKLTFVLVKFYCDDLINYCKVKGQFTYKPDFGGYNLKRDLDFCFENTCSSLFFSVLFVSLFVDC